MIIYNAVIYSVSVLLLVSTRLNESKIRYLLAFIGLSLLQILLGESNYFGTISCYVMLVLCFCQKQNFKQDAYDCLCSISMITIFVILFGSLWLLVSSKTKAYDWVIGALIFFTALTWKITIYFCQKGEKQRQATHFGMILQVIPLLFYTFLLPTIQFLDSRDLAIVSLFFISNLFIVNQLLDQLQNYKQNIEQHKKDLEQMLEMQKHIDGIIEQEHSFMQIAQTLQAYIDRGDIDALKTYYESNISPVVGNLMQIGGLENIENELLRNFIQWEIDGIHKQKNVIVSIVIQNNIVIPINEMFDVIRIVIEFFANAKKELKKQKKAYLRVHFVQNRDEIMLQVSNSLKESDKNYFETIQNKHDGLDMIARLVEKSPIIRNVNYISPVLYLGWRMFYQELYISLEG